MRILSFLLVLVLLARPAVAFDRLSDTFDPNALNFQEKRILQAMLVLEGTYKARLDGAWGRGSQSALEQALNAKYGKGPATWERMAMLAHASKEGMKTDRWTAVFINRTGTSYLIPSKVMDPTVAATTAQFLTDDNSMRVRSFSGTDQQSQLIHQRIRTKARRPDQLYRVNRASLRISAGQLRDGTNVYLRSEKVPSSEQPQGAFVNTMVEWSQEQAPVAQLIVSSVKQGSQDDLKMPAGWLRRAIARLDKPRKPAKPDAATKQPDTSGQLKFRGVGIYINNTDLIVAQAAVDACKTGLKLTDGTNLTQLERLPVLDMVIMTSPKRSAQWMRVFDGDLPQDSDLSAVYIPNRSWQTNQTGTKSARILGGFSFGEGKTQYITLLPGTSPYRGAPLLNTNGEMVGVLLGAPDLKALTGSRGRASREFSVAISTKPLSPMLHRRGVVHQRETTKASGDATQPDKALVAVACDR